MYGMLCRFLSLSVWTLRFVKSNLSLARLIVSVITVRYAARGSISSKPGRDCACQYITSGGTVKWIPPFFVAIELTRKITTVEISRTRYTERPLFVVALPLQKRNVMLRTPPMW